MKKIINRLLLCLCAVILIKNQVIANEINEQPVPDYSWYGDGSKVEYTISDINDLIGFANIVNGNAQNIEKDTFLNKIIKLEKNIDLTNVTWTPIGSSMYVHDALDESTKKFEGTFDGGNFIIKGLNTDNYIPASSDVGAGEYSFGLFGYAHGANFKNVRLSHVDIEGCDKEADGTIVGGSGVAALVGYYVPMDGATSVIENCHVLSGTVKATNNMGGLIGFCEIHGNSVEIDITIKKCTNRANVITQAREAGGIFGLFQNANSDTGTIKFENCINEGSVTTEDGGVSSCAAGIFGRDNSSPSANLKIYFEKCINTGKITTIGRKNSEVHASGIANVYYSNGSTMIAKNCTNLGEIVVEGTPSDIFIDEIFAYVQKRTQSTCYNLGKITNIEEKIRITYDSNGGDFSTTYQELAKGDEVKISNTVAVPIREGYTFLGWNTKADGTGTFYKDESKATFNDFTVLYAQWGKMSETWGVIDILDEVYTGKEIKPNVVVVDDNGEIISNGYDIEFSDNLVDVGIKKVIVTYNNENIEMEFNILKDEFPTLFVEDVLTEYGTKYSVSVSAYTSAGNEILEDDSVELMYYTDSECNLRLDSLPEESGIYYVNAKLLESSNYAESFSSEPAMIEISKVTPSIKVKISDWTYGEAANEPIVVKNSSNSEVVYYYKLIDADDSEYVAEVPNSAGNYILKAVIEESNNYNEVNTYVEFCINQKTLLDGMITLDNNTFMYDGTIKTPKVTLMDIINEEPKILLEGVDYVFDIDSENAGIDIKDYEIKIVGIGDYTGTILTTWKIIAANYNVSLILDDGILNEENITNYTPGTSVKLPTNIQKKGYKFKGWYDNELFIGESITEISEDDIGDKVFYAKWEKRNVTSIKTYEVETDISGSGIVKISDDTPIKGKKVNVDVIPAEGYKFESIAILNCDGREIDVLKIDENKYEFVQNNDNVVVEVLFKKHIEDHDSESDYSSNQFLDVDQEAWYHEAVDYVVENNLMNGVSDEQFDLFGSTTRAMFITILWRIENEPVVNYFITAEDVEKEMWYTEAVRWALAEKIIEGYNDGKVGCNDFVTREQMITILYRYMNYKNGNVTIENTTNFDFEDMDEISDWSSEAFKWAIESKVMIGNDDGALNPKSNIKRVETAMILMRYMKLNI